MYLQPLTFISSVGWTLWALAVIRSTTAATLANNAADIKGENQVLFLTSKSSGGSRDSRALHEITLNDPLNCLSRVVCGLHKFPPKRPTLRTSTTNDYAFLLRTVLSKISKYNQIHKDDELFDDVKEKEADEDQDGDEATEDDEEYSEEEDDDKVGRKTSLRSSRSPKLLRQGRRYSERSGDPSIIGSASDNLAKEFEELALADYNRKVNKQNVFEQFKPNVDLDKLELLRVSTDLGEKLSSSPADQCAIHGICPYRYDEMVKLISGILKRQTIVSPSGDKIIPLVGYILKSRNQTTTLTATFSAIERINNLTYAADNAGTPITFRHVYEEVLNGMGTGSSGIRVVDDSNEKASSNVWEDDEFDQVLNNPYVEKKLATNYVLKNKLKIPPKPIVEDESSEEDQEDDPFQFVDFDSERDEEVILEDNSEETNKKKSKFSDLLSKKKNTPPPPPPPAFGGLD